MRNETARHDITVVGGGLAGVCAAIAAARLGRTVALINNRPVLGGNSSSEVRVWVCGATGHGKNHHAREGGIMGELLVENQFRNPDGNPYYWDTVVLDAVRAEPNLTLYLNTDVREVEAEGPDDMRRITAVTGWTMGSERRIRFESKVFLDCTGDGLIGHLAGAHHRIGREAHAEYGEPWAPGAADDITLGSTLLFYTKDAGRPVKYVPPNFAKDISKTSIPQRRIIKAGDNGCAYWWIEFGGELDTVHDNEEIRDELWAVIYGIWDHIKNSGGFDAETMTLEWVGSVPGKREYRRFLGDYVLHQGDILGQSEFADRVAFGGWSIDLHPPQGVYAAEDGAKQRYTDGIYHIPYRSLYSVNTSNLLFAGRNISASHVAFGSTRVMATCATIGQAAGTAAALCAEQGLTPRALDVPSLQRTLLREDASVIGLTCDDSADLAPRARVTASSTLACIAVETPDEPWQLTADAGIVLPVDPQLTGIELLLDAEHDTEVVIELYDPVLGQNYVPRRLVATATVPVPAGSHQWVKTGLEWSPATPRNAFVLVRANEALALHTADRPTPGVLCFTRIPLRPQDEAPQPLREWTDAGLLRRTFCLRTGETSAFAPTRAVDGYLRPYAGPHQWVSEPSVSGAWLELAWPEPVTLHRIEVIADDDVNEDLINLHHHRTPFDTLPTLLRDYRIEARGPDGSWHTLSRTKDNRRRRTSHPLAEEVTTDALRVVVEATNGAASAHIVAVRAYAQE
ncbi:FAD-dependent oxidoreductase [Streptomyces beijiangensis]|uniref:FAD-dependent oxidoreductase n=1 Tax=Streptomyces beijiangensis TaxID=163361 RepID=A0A939FBM7_9ACTN|nr:FAD-dependent oxidoreductase [Streptomyces beijiangensis]MBO0514050.1 FAD-dependent oxidoreductase [Streptomyces beijiangensis]